MWPKTKLSSMTPILMHCVVEEEVEEEEEVEGPGLLFEAGPVCHCLHCLPCR